jgi:hypothetical protein
MDSSNETYLKVCVTVNLALSTNDLQLQTKCSSEPGGRRGSGDAMLVTTAFSLSGRPIHRKMPNFWGLELHLKL